MSEHNHPQRKQIINRMSRIVGHANAVKRMCEEGKECTDILIQIAAVRSALNNVGKLILEDHVDHCVTEAVENNDKEAIEKLRDAIDKFVK